VRPGRRLVVCRYARLLRLAAALAAIAGGTAIAAAEDAVGTIAVTVLGVPSTEGVIRYAVFADRTTFDSHVPPPEFEGDCPIEVYRCAFSVAGLLYGEYAVMVYHDKNRNREYDWSIFDRERVGVSNYEERLWSAPNYDRAKFQHRAARTAIEIRLY
jgi:uncharacterized protein (DUF2141 family)